MAKPTWKTFFDVLAFVVVFVVPVVLYLMEKAGIDLKPIFIVGWLSIAAASLYLVLNLPWVWNNPDIALRAWRAYAVCSIALLAVGYASIRIWPTHSTGIPEANKNAKPDNAEKSVIALFLDCTYEDFPIRISAGSTIHVLRIHPAVIKSSPKAVAFLDVGAPGKEDRTWPQDREAPPLPAFMSTGEPVRHALVMKCTVRKYGKGTVEKALISLQLAGRYNLLIDPLESSGAFESFSFYLLNACYTDLKPGEYDGAGGMSPPIVGEFPEKAKLQIIGEPDWKEVPLTVSYRQNSTYRTILLMPVHRRWRDLPPC